MRFERGGIRLDRQNDGELDDRSNTVTYEKVTYALRPLSEENENSKGGNSSVFVLKDPNGSEPDRAIKISNVYRPSRNTPEHLKRRYGRFIDEVDALHMCNELAAPNIVRLLWDAAILINETLKNGTVVQREYPYYVMEKANTDLKEFLLKDPDTDIQTRVQLCYDVQQAIKQLHAAGFYHRDIKPDNVLLFGSTSTEDDGARTLIWKIGDLGLIASRQKNYDELGEKVGPLGWLSPEAGNKFLTEKYKLGLDCVIDDRSDVFQLGKLIWFIFQHNIPIGIISREDWTSDVKESDRLFNAVSSSLQHSKTRRYDMNSLESDLAFMADLYHA